MVTPFTQAMVALAEAGVRFVVVGGVAVVLQGHARLTVDLDVVLDLAEENVRAAIDVLTSSGLHPRLPVSAQDFADPATREGWVRERGLVVFSLHDPSDARREVDLFAQYPLPFEDLWARADVVEIPGTTVRVASIDDLIAMKETARRPQDLADIAALRALRGGDGIT
jgi:predicted nucleotidyltransferase